MIFRLTVCIFGVHASTNAQVDQTEPDHELEVDVVSLCAVRDLAEKVCDSVIQKYEQDFTELTVEVYVEKFCKNGWVSLHPTVYCPAKVSKTMPEKQVDQRVQPTWEKFSLQAIIPGASNN